MPFRRRRTPYRRRPKRRPLPKATKAKVKAIVRRELRSAEPLHYVDEYSTGAGVHSTAAFVDLSDAIAQGDGIGDRQGDTIVVRSIQGDCALVRDSTATVSPYFARIILFKWFPDSAIDAPDIVTDILEDSSNAGQQSPYVLDLAKRKKFRVLRDYHYLLGDVDHPAIPDTRAFRFKVNLGSRMGKIQYNDNATTGRGKFYMMLYANQVSGTEDALLRYHITLKFDP